MKQTAKIYLDPDSKDIITRVTFSQNGHDTEPLPMERHQSDLLNLLFGQPPQLFFVLGKNRDILSCYHSPTKTLEYINSGSRPFLVTSGGRCLTVPPHSIQRVTAPICTPPAWDAESLQSDFAKTSISAEEFLGRSMLLECPLRDITVCWEGDLHQWESPFSHPAYWMRGKPVTPQQAFQIIRRTDSIFGDLPLWGAPLHSPVQTRDFLPLHCLESLWFSECHFGWCRPDGRIGADSVLSGYPDAKKLVMDGIRLLHAFPFLDLILLIWNSNETWEFQPIQLKDAGMPSIGCGVHLHNGTVELLTAKSAWDRFCAYQRKYGEDPLHYWSGYNLRNGSRFVDRGYLDRCLEAGDISFASQVEWDPEHAADASEQSLAAVDLRYQLLREACETNEVDQKRVEAT